MILKNINQTLNQFLEDTKFWATKNMSNKAQEIYDEHKMEAEQEVECPTCDQVKISNPTPDGDETCPDCGELEMLDKDPALNGLRDAKDLSEGMYDDGSEESKKAERSILEQEHNNYFK